MVSLLLRRAGLFSAQSWNNRGSPCFSFSSSPNYFGGTNAIVTTDLSEIPVDRVRNFSIIAHVDHGKSTLADRILEHVGAIDKADKNKQILDKLQVERERGITVKAQTASVMYSPTGKFN